MQNDRTEYYQEYYRRNREKRKEYFKNYYEKHKDKLRKQRRDNYQADKEKLLSAYEKYYKEHPDDKSLNEDIIRYYENRIAQLKALKSPKKDE